MIVAIGASVAAVFIIVLTLICLCMWRLVGILHPHDLEIISVASEAVINHNASSSEVNLHWETLSWRTHLPMTRATV